MFGKQEDIFPEDKETKKARRKEKDLWADEPDQNLDRVVRVSELPETLDKKKKITAKSVVIMLAFVILVVGSGFLAAYGISTFNGHVFSIQEFWPVILSVDVFLFSTIGFFSTGGKTEKLYGVFSVLSAACFVVELLIRFA